MDKGKGTCFDKFFNYFILNSSFIKEIDDNAITSCLKKLSIKTLDI